MDSINIENFCASKNIIKKVKRQPTEWKKLDLSHVYSKSLVSIIYKELLQLNNNKRQTIQLKNGHRAHTGIFPKKMYKWPSTRKDAQHH